MNINSRCYNGYVFDVRMDFAHSLSLLLLLLLLLLLRVPLASCTRQRKRSRFFGTQAHSRSLWL